MRDHFIGRGALQNRMVRVDFTEKAAFKERPERNEGVSHRNF